MADMRTPLARVRGLGAAREGTETFWRQRLTAVSNIPLILFFIGLIAALSGATYAEVRETLGNPFVALVMMLMIVSALVHMRIGMKEIIEDYVHDELTRIVLVMLSTFFAFAVGAACIFALIKLGFGG